MHLVLLLNSLLGQTRIYHCLYWGLLAWTCATVLWCFVAVGHYGVVVLLLLFFGVCVCVCVFLPGWWWSLWLGFCLDGGGPFDKESIRMMVVPLTRNLSGWWWSLWPGICQDDGGPFDQESVRMMVVPLTRNLSGWWWSLWPGICQDDGGPFD